MKDEAPLIILAAINGLHEAFHSRDALNLATSKLLHKRLAILEAGLCAVFPGFEKGCKETADLFAKRIAEIESQHESIEARIVAAKASIEGLMDG